MTEADLPITPAILDDFIVYLTVDRDLRKQTIENHKSNINLFLSFLQGRILNPTTFREFIIYEKSLHKDAGTLQGYIYTIRVLCEYFIKCGTIDNNWGRTIPLPRRMRKLPEILSIEEIEAIINAPITYKGGLDRFTWDTLLIFLSQTGCRIGEALGSHTNQLDLKKGTWLIKETKTNSQRLVPLSPLIVNNLTKLIKDKTPNDYIFTSNMPRYFNHRLSPSSVNEEIKKRCHLVGITKNATCHTFRHSFITELLRQDISILKVAMIVGHEEVGTTQRYAKLVMEDLKSAITRHPLISKTRNPYEILEHIKQTIKSFRLDEDKRFFYEISEGNDGVRVNIFIR